LLRTTNTAAHTASNKQQLIAGTYIVTVTDDHSCTATTTVTITEPTLLTATISASTNVSCFGGNNGSATVTAAGGVASYTYNWSNGTTTAVNNNLIAGTYTVTITDDHGCTATTSVTITEPTLLTANISASANVLCFGGNDGSATVTAAGGVAPYTYNWSNGATTASNNNLIAGTYTVTVTDDHACTATTSVTITEPTLLTATISASTNVSCFGGNNGSATVTAAGGVAPYTYNWSNGTTTAVNSHLIAGTYTVTVTDDHGCTATCLYCHTSVTITEPTLLTATISASANVLCFGGNDGSATVTAAGGVAPYTYNWSNGTTTATNNNLIAGTYTVTVTDDHGCTATTSVTITEPTLLITGIVSSVNVLCFGGNAGSALAGANGGVLPYTYLWSNGVNTPDNNNLTAGTYTVTITDAHGCSGSSSVTITEPTLLIATISASANVLCFSGNDGSATVTAAGGVAPYTYNWSNGTTTASNNNLIAGTYTVTVTDDHACTATTSVTITEPTLLTATISASTNVSCFGGNNGSATVTAAGGVAPYTYNWSNGTTTASNNNLIAGTYTVTVTDDHGCTATTSVTITEPTLLITGIVSSVNVLCFGGNDGSALAGANGGVLPYTYLWSNGVNTPDNNNLTAGTYTVTITDAHGCSGSSSVTITEPTLLIATISASANVLCFSGNDGSATVTAAGGVAPYTYNWSNGTATASNNNLIAGTYTVTVTDDHGCTATASVSITEPTLLTATISASTNVSCFSGNDGSATITAAGGVAPYTYNWSNGTTTATNNNLITGTYTVTVTDDHGCTATTSVTITEPTLLTATISASANVLCFSGNDGSATVTAAGGVAPYTYNWSNGTNTATNNNLIAGTYTVTITDDHGCTATTSVTITEPTLLTANISASANVLCFGGNDGSATVTAAGGVAPYTYNWSNGTTTASNNNLIAGTYTVTVTDDHGCTATASVTITEPTLLTATISASANVLCFAGNDGSATVTAAGGVAPYTYNWSNGTTTAVNSHLIAGTYTVTVTDDHGCTATTSVTITEPTLLTATISASANVLCFSGNDGSATVTAAGGVAPYTYNWSNGTTTASNNNLIAGTYTVTVTDDHGCTATTSVTITEPTLLITGIVSSVNVLCFGGNDGSALAGANGGVLPYTYLWSNGVNTPDNNNLTAGTYTVTITDAHGCSGSSSVTIAEPTLLTATISASANVLCFAGNDGSATVTAAGGVAPYSYNWSNGTTTAVNSHLIAGTYTVTVTDDHGCTATTSVTITEPTLLTATISASANVLCFSGNDGSATVTAAGGVALYTYNWSNGTTTASNNNLIAGTYTVTVTDDHGCIATASVTITEPTLLTATISASANVLCFSGNDGSATVTAAGGVAPYTYNWSNGTTTASNNNLIAGTYTVTVTDDHGCTATASVTITEPTLLTATISASANVLCFSGNDGSATVTAAGGVAPYTYNWSNGTATASNNNLIAGTYTVTVTDDHGCTATTSVTITEPTLLTATISASTNVSCFGGNNGSATVTAAGGVAPYTYNWSNGATTASNNNLIAGTYSVTVTDDHGCTATTSVTITEPTLLTATISASANVLCFSGNDGSATVTAAGGVAPYTYNWSNGTTTATNNNLIAGTYTVTITDDHGCTATTSVTITEPTLLTANISASANVLCFGGNDGSATVTAAGGVAPYTYNWSNGTTTASNNNLIAGTYTVTVTDDHGCTATASVTITEPTLLTATISASANVLCFAGNDGSATVTAAGGVAPYTYNWSNGTTTAVNSHLIAGTYTVTVTDDHGCTATTSVTITEPTLLTATISASANVLCFGGNDGSATVTAAGGVAPYTYNWSNGTTTASNNNLIAGTYTVTVTDDHGCTATTSVTITEPTLLITGIVSSVNVLCFGGNDGSALAGASGGVLPYTYLWSNGVNTPDNNNLTAGTYTVTITDAHGCSGSSSVTITEPTLLIATISASANVLCFGGNNGSATVTAAGGVAPYTYNWSNGTATASNNNLIAGTYTVTVTDDHGCTATTNVTITEPTLLTATISASANVLCFGGNNGSATVTAAGGVAPYTYNWSNGATTASNNNLIAGTYTVTVTDDHGCTATASVSITEPTLLTATISASANVLCFSGNDGSATVTAAGGVAPYTYNWSNGTTTASNNNLIAGTYTVTVTDDHGCTATASVTITEPTLLTATISASANVLCFSGNDGSATVTAAGGVAPYTYNWSNGTTTASNNNLIAGTYTVTITDDHGCTATTSVTITEPTLLTAAISASANILCFGGNDGSAAVTAAGGVAPYTYNWSNGTTTASNNNLIAGTYTVTVTDDHGCTATTSVTITEPTLLTATISASTNVSCFGGNDGSGTVTAAGGVAPYTYNWSNGTTTATNNNLIAGTYSVTVTDDHGCTASTTVTITENALLITGIVSSADVLCFGGNDGSALAGANGGVLPYTYIWSNGVNTPDNNNLTAGTYSVTISDAFGCSGSSSVTITEPTLLIATISASANVLCFAGNDGSATVTAAGGVAPYTYNWSNGTTTAGNNNLIAGTYNVTVTDDHGCTATTSVTITEPTLLTASISASANVSCFGGNDGSATVTAAGGVAPYTYNWSNGTTTATNNNLIAGTYTVTVTDDHGCTATTSVTITEPTLLTATISASANVLCFSGNDGSATVTAAGGVAPYTYNWSNGATTAGNNNLIAGTYSVTVTDDHGCTATTSVTITEPTLLTATISASANVLCFSGNDGSATVTAAGGVAPYTYNWSSGTSTASNNNLIAGTYTVTVTDDHGCTATTSVTITEPTLLTATISASANVLCFSGNDGSAAVTAAGGVAPYTYNWSNGTTTATNNNLIAGTYTVTITDDHGCTATTSVTITEPTLLTSTISASTNVSCFGGNDGSGTVTAAGGVAPYTYNWSNGTTTATNNNLIAGTYTVTVTDDHGCTATTSVTITEPTLLTSTISASTNVSCFGGNNGSATVTAAGGVAPYAYNWSNGATTASNNNLIAGTYTVTVTDDHGCTATTSVTITEPTLLTATISASTNVSCFGGNNGSATVTAAGGVASYIYNWSNGTTTAVNSHLIAGTYTVTITDDHGCTATTSVTITEPTLLTATISASTNVSCFGGNDGSATVTAAGGVAPYTYNWSNGSLNNSNNGLTAGIYSVTVTDAHNCTAVVSVTITQPAILSGMMVNIVDVSCFGGNDGSATIQIMGGTPAYSYLWSNNNNSATNNNLTAGSYTVTVTDANGCIVMGSVTITEPTLLTATISASANVLCFGGNDGSATVTAAGGVAPYTYNWSNGATTASNNNLIAGTYTVTVTDDHGCTATTSVTITEPTLLTATISASANVLCFGGNNGSATVTTAGGVAPYTYNWSNGTTTASNNNLIAGTYTVTVTDDHGCTATTSVTITEPTLLTSTISASANVLCFSGNDGSATVSAAGGVAPYTYNWSNGTTTAVNNNLIAGTYTVTVTDAHACTATTSVTITEPTLLTATISGSINVSCYGGSNGSATVTANGGVTPYTYNWSNGATSATNIGITAGTYTVTVTDANGCTETASISIIEPSLLVSSSMITSDVSCFGGNNGYAAITVNGGVMPYSYNWSNGNLSAANSNLTAGIYNVTVTDANGCVLTSSANIIQPDLLEVTLSATDVSCFMGNNGTATATVSGGTQPYTYLWSPSGGNTAFAAGLTAGTYSVLITDGNNCQATESITIAQPTQLLSQITGVTHVSCNGYSDGSATVGAANGTAPYTYLWSNGATTATATGLSAGTYHVTVTDFNGCISVSAAFINQPQPFVMATSPSTTVCNGNIVTISAWGSGGTAPYTFTWDNGLGTGSSFNVQILGSVTYNVTGTDANGCTAGTASININMNSPLNVMINAPSDVCTGDGVTLNAFASGGVPPYTFTWNNGIGIAYPPVNVQPVQSGYYIVTVTDACGSILKSDSAWIDVRPLPSPNFTLDNLHGCENMVVTFTDHSVPQMSSYFWDFGDPESGAANFSTSPSPSHQYAQEGSYGISLTLTNQWGCMQTFNYNNLIAVYPRPIASFWSKPEVVTMEDPQVQFINESFNDDHWYWNFGDHTNIDNTSETEHPSHIYQEPGTYNVTLVVESGHGCFDTAYGEVLVNDYATFYIPNAFTPNDDNVNDFFGPKGTNIDNSGYEFYIYNRWGVLVFETKDFNHHWDGRKMGTGDVLPQDVYTWIILFKENIGLEHKYVGSVTLIK
jgi:gliding motility-associated-like protein